MSGPLILRGLFVQQHPRWAWHSSTALPAKCEPRRTGALSIWGLCDGFWVRNPVPPWCFNAACEEHALPHPVIWGLHTFIWGAYQALAVCILDTVLGSADSAQNQTLLSYSVEEVRQAFRYKMEKVPSGKASHWVKRDVVLKATQVMDFWKVGVSHCRWASFSGVLCFGQKPQVRPMWY